MTYEEALAAMRQAFTADTRACRRDYRPRGSDWNQITEAEGEVFQIPPHEVPRLVTLHRYCRAFHKTDADDEPYRDLKPLPFMATPAYRVVKRRLNDKLDLRDRTPQEKTFLELAALLGIPVRLAHAWHYKDLFWQVRNEFMGFPERRPDPANKPPDDEIPFY